MEAIDKYFELQEVIFQHFGYEEGYRIIPLDDQRFSYWMLVGGEGEGAKVVYSSIPFTADSIRSGEVIYSALVYTQRFLSKYVYRAEGFTMVAADTQVDGNKLLMIFDNNLECTDESLRTLYDQCW